MLQTAHTAVAAALSLIYWVQLMRALNTSFSTAACGASFYTDETDAKTPHIFVTGGLRTAWELTELLWLFTRGRRVRKRKMERRNSVQNDLQVGATCVAACPTRSVPLSNDQGLVQQSLALPAPFSWHIPDHKYGPYIWGREAAGAGVSHGPHDRGIPLWLLAAVSGLSGFHCPSVMEWAILSWMFNSSFSSPFKIEDPDLFIYLFILIEQFSSSLRVWFFVNKRIPGSQQAPEYLVKASKSSYILHSAHPLD